MINKILGNFFIILGGAIIFLNPLINGKPADPNNFMLLTWEQDQTTIPTEHFTNEMIFLDDNVVTFIDFRIATEEVLKFDINGDGKTGLEEAIHSLQIVSGVKTDAPISDNN